ncbi:hypothetical protein A2011_03630 [candidate division CPR3 bacterium GWE2_35_7]|nr:MAG: hypothetical protein UR87_C0029G0005 [candidate division CPR3 bacterium GW2011_GWE2_35_7]OGB80194.1 MAG: hypothetical protein A2011_03630 [candidate division CPR3 bacterium GWE2_35_7]
MSILEINNFILHNQAGVFIALGLISIFLFIVIKRIKGSKAMNSITIEDGVLLAIEVPRFNEKGALAAEQMFASLHGLLKYTPGIQEHISFEITSSAKGIKFYVFLPSYFHKFVESQIYAQYPSAEIKVIEDYSQMDVSSYQFVGSDITMSREYFFPIKTFRDFEVDPLAAITGAFEKLEDPNGQVWFQILIRPIPDDWQDPGHAYVSAVREGNFDEKSALGKFVETFTKEIGYIITGIIGYLFRPDAEIGGDSATAAAKQQVRLSAGQDIALKAIENKLTKLGFEAAVRVITFAEDEEKSQKQLSSEIASLKQFSTANLNSFERSPIVTPNQILLQRYRERYFPTERDSSFVLNIEELASVFHLPSESVETPNIAWVDAKRGEPPLTLPLTDCTYIGKTIFRDTESVFGIKTEDRRQHMYVIGKTGTGKSTLMKNMIINDMKSGRGVGVLDPHGDLIEELLQYVPLERINDVVIFDPSDANYPVSMNMLELFDPSQKDLYASGLLDVFKKYFGYSWGPRLEHILRNCILTLLEIPNSTLLGITRILIDKNYESYIVDQVKDPVVKAFWQEEFANIRGNQRLFSEAIQPIQNKVGQFLSAATVRNIVGQAKSSIEIDDIINTGKIFFVNLSKGKIGADNSSLLGAMIISRLQFAAMARVKIPESERRDFYVYADEFQNFATESFSNVLSEARKYRLSLILAHQYIDQLPEEVREAVFGNVGTIVAFTIGSKDARFLEKEFAPTFEESDLVNLQRHYIYIKMMIDGMTSNPFSAVTLAPQGEITNKKEEIIALSRQKFSRELETVENRVRKWTETKFKKGMKLVIKDKPGQNKEKLSTIDDIEEYELPKGSEAEAPKTENMNITSESEKIPPISEINNPIISDKAVTIDKDCGPIPINIPKPNEEKS